MPKYVAAYGKYFRLKSLNLLSIEQLKFADALAFVISSCIP